MPRTVTAIAHPNIALIKYWGKKDAALNLPAAGSISVTLDELATRTTVSPCSGNDRVVLNGTDHQDAKVIACLDRLRAIAHSDQRFEIISDNNFPTAAGLASSASGFAALVTAAAAALDLDLSPAELSRHARMGSGSAARSIFGGFVRMSAGSATDGSDAIAVPIQPAEHWPLRIVVGITSHQAKQAGSTVGMESTARTSPYYPAWVATTEADLDPAHEAIERRDFDRLADLSEHSCLKMHATMLASRPPLIYWNPATVGALHAVRQLRADGVQAFFTIDAGPQLKVICTEQAQSAVIDALHQVGGVLDVRAQGLGAGARVTDP